MFGLGGFSLEERFIHSFRYKNLLYSLLSMFLAILTAGVFLLGIYLLTNLTEQNEDVVPVIEESTTNNTILTNKDYQNYTTNVPVTANSISTGKGVWTIAAVIAVVVCFVSFSIYFSLFTKQFSKYLQEIVSGIDELSTGNFNISIPLRNDDELTQIAKNLNRMARDIKGIMESERKTEHKKNELITNVAHDLRTPLTSILGYLDIVATQPLTDEQKDKYIAIAYNKSKRLEKLIEDLFTYTKLEFGQVQLHRSDVDVVKMMEQLLEEFYPSFCENHLEYSFKTNESSIEVNADGDLLARAFANLISNAIRYGANGKNINVCIEGNAEKVSISVTNYGEIIPKKDLNLIFEKFFRVRNEEQGGTGLGLAITKNIVAMHGGIIRVRSDLNGTVFEITLDKR